MVTENIVRKIDSLGRITLPKGLRDRMDIVEGNEFEILTDNDMICLRKADKKNSKAAIEKGKEDLLKMYNNHEITVEDALNLFEEIVYNEFRKNI